MLDDDDGGGGAGGARGYGWRGKKHGWALMHALLLVDRWIDVGTRGFAAIAERFMCRDLRWGIRVMYCCT
jgi:hypothetical protein